MLVSLPEIEIHNLHRCPFASAAPLNQFSWRFEVAPQHKFAVRHYDSKTAPGMKYAIHFPSDLLPVLEREVLHHMLTEDSIERPIGKRKRPTKVDEVVNILIGKSIHIHPMRIVQPAWARAQVEKQRGLQIRNRAMNSRFLPGEYIPDPESKKVNVPTRDCQEPVTKKPEEKIAQENGWSRVVSVKRRHEFQSAPPAPQASQLDLPVWTSGQQCANWFVPPDFVRIRCRCCGTEVIQNYRRAEYSLTEADQVVFCQPFW